MNPSESRVSTAQGAGLINQSGLNNPATVNRESYNTFNKSRVRLGTQRFNQVMPIYCESGLEGDVLRLRTSHDLRTYTLKSPLLSNLTMHRSFFQVPWSSICPNTWELLYRIPVKGVDIDFDTVMPSISVGKLIDFFSSGISYLASNVSRVPANIDFFACCWSIFGRASLLKGLGVTLPFEEYGDKLKSAVVEYFKADTENDYDLDFVDRDLKIHKLTHCSTRTIGEIYNFLDDYVDFAAQKMNYNSNLASGVTPTIQPKFWDDMSTFFADSSLGSPSSWSGSTRSINLMPVIAYQQILAQFYSSSHVDDVYSAKMWSQVMLSNIQTCLSGVNPYERTFTCNGVAYDYDAFGGDSLGLLLTYLSPNQGGSSIDSYKFAMSRCVIGLFRIGRSMRFGDYFTSARTQPLAVGDVSINAASGKVSAIDTNKAMWMQRLLNAVNRAPQSIYAYIRSIAGVSPAREEPRPNFISSESFNIGNMEVENTAQEQGNIVTLLRNSESRFIFEAFIDEPSFVIGVNTFSVQYVYPHATPKVFYMKERLQWFNSFMQHTGDQSLDLAEVTTPLLSSDYDDATFGYQLRYAEFKNAISQALGGFIDGSLPSWALIYDDSVADASHNVLSEQFIRNTNSDFDKLYSSLTGDNDSNRFHFIYSIYFDNPTNSKQQAYPSLI